MEHRADEQLTPDEERALAALRTPADPSPRLYERVRSDLARDGGFIPPGRHVPLMAGGSPFRWLRPLAAAAALALAYGIGARSAAAPPAVAEGTQYAFFLLNTPEPRWPDGVSQAQIVEQFRAWTEPLAADGRLVLADELAADHELVDATGTRSGERATGMNGFFIVTAPDDSSAMALARTLPHVRQGGVVAVQRLMNR